MASVLLFVLLSSVCFSVGYSLLKDSDEAVGIIDCRYSQKEYDDAISEFDLPVIGNPNVGVPALPEPIAKSDIDDLGGVCAIDALEKAKQLGVIKVRDLSDCWSNCVVTDDFNPNRLTFHVDGNIMLDPSLG